MFFFLLLSLATSCQEEVEKAAPNEKNLFLPLQIGNEWVYDQIEIAYEISGFDTTNQQVRERVVDADTSSSGVISFTVERSTRINESFTWQLEAFFNIRQSDDWVIRQNESQVVTIMDLPVRKGGTWDYHSHSTLQANIVRYAEESDDFIESFSAIFDDQGEEIFIVIADTEQNIVNQNQQYERYIAGVGLVEKKSIILEFCTVNCESSGQINTGIFFNKKLISYHVGTE